MSESLDFARFTSNLLSMVLLTPTVISFNIFIDFTMVDQNLIDLTNWKAGSLDFVRFTSNLLTTVYLTQTVSSFNVFSNLS